MEEDWDVIVVGNGLKENLLGALLAHQAKKRVLHIIHQPVLDESAQAAVKGLAQLSQRVKRDEAKVESTIEKPDIGEFVLDLNPRLIVSGGSFVKVLMQTGAHKLLEFATIDKRLIAKADQVYEVPKTPGEVSTCNLLGFFQKSKYRKFLEWIGQYDKKDPKTIEGIDMKGVATGKFLRQNFGLDDAGMLLAGLGMGMFESSSLFLEKPLSETIDQLQLGYQSTFLYGRSQFIFPLGGLNNVSNAALRASLGFKSRVLKSPTIKDYLFDSSGSITIVTDRGSFNCKHLIASTTYFPDKVTRRSQIGRLVLAVKELPLKFRDGASGSLVIPGEYFSRMSNLHLMWFGIQHKMVPNLGKFLVHISGLIESSDFKKDYQAFKELFEDPLEEFFYTLDVLQPLKDSLSENVFVTSSENPSQTLEDLAAEVIDIYQKVTSKILDLGAIDLEQKYPEFPMLDLTEPEATTGTVPSVCDAVVSSSTTKTSQIPSMKEEGEPEEGEPDPDPES